MAALACLAVYGCGRDSDKESRSTVLSGPVGTEYSAHPKIPPGDRLVLAGCCSFDVRGTRVTKLEGDVDGRLIESPGFRIEVSFGNGLARPRPEPSPTTLLNIDGVSLFRAAGPRAARGEARFIYWAIVPLEPKARTAAIQSPGLEVKAWCTDARGCSAATRIIEGVRF
jgi:hypothetical protein